MTVFALRADSFKPLLMVAPSACSTRRLRQITLAGSDGSQLSGAPAAGKVVGPSFSSFEVPDVIEAILDTYKQLRVATANGKQEAFIETLHRVGHDPFKAAANAARHPAEEHSA